MSALYGIWSFGDPGVPPDALFHLSDAQRAFGPDDDSRLSIGSIALGRRLYRLVPQDHHDRQPVDDGGRFALVADLRIDNRDWVRERLGPGDFAQTSDAELLLRLWASAGPRSIAWLNGDFAFALYDRRDECLWLGRDPLGQRPLHWRRTEREFAFASMPRPLASMPGLRCAIDSQHLAEFVSDLPMDGDRSFFEEVRRVEPGHLLRVTRQGASARRYWRPEPRNLGLRNVTECADALREQLDAAVARKSQRRLGGLAAHLSAGWDSSAVATSAALQLSAGETLEAFTAAPAEDFRGPVLPGKLADESPLAAEVAAMHRNIRHHIVRSKPIDLERLFAWTHPLAGRPTGSVFNHAWWQRINEQAAGQGARVLLTAELGNISFSFGGQLEALPDFLAERRYRELLREVRYLRGQGRSLRSIADHTLGGRVPAGLYRLLARAVRGSRSPRELTFVDSRWRPELMRRHAQAGWDERPPRHSLERRRDLIRMVDSGVFRKLALARWGIDERDPTADVEFIQFCVSLPPVAFLSDGRTKPAARMALADRLPRAVLENPLRGVQSADWKILVRPEQIRAQLDQPGPASEVLDLAKSRDALDRWANASSGAFTDMFELQFNLLRAAAAAHFGRTACG